MAASVVAAGVTSEAKGAEMQVAEVTVGNPEPERLAADRVAVGVATEEAAPEVEGRVVAPAAAAEEGREVDMAAERATGTMVKAAAARWADREAETTVMVMPEAAPWDPGAARMGAAAAAPEEPVEATVWPARRKSSAASAGRRSAPIHRKRSRSSVTASIAQAGVVAPLRRSVGRAWVLSSPPL